MLIIWGRLNSHNVKKVVWMAEEAGILYERRDIGGQFGFTDDYIARNPNRLIPTIEHHGFVLWESNAILRYMAAQFAGELWPTDLEKRASADRWMDWQFAYADAQRDAFLNLVRRQPGDRDAAAIAASARRTGEMMAILDDALAYAECAAEQFVEAGDHILVLGRVLYAEVLNSGEPLTSTFTGWSYSG